ncbi:hypothetical protein BV22DRAFT_1126926 [Leucogyrophana mollusca]|uniref:Uncharacterized protein n=1 Tax=Leucogyrophana mollusca TaxID=85980 RepID=A0ACB8BS91_9AGAM|nr:hypothetical protein BV22DRAFT_1126926 [Leucogyrophana mollusca]
MQLAFTSTLVFAIFIACARALPAQEHRESFVRELTPLAEDGSAVRDFAGDSPVEKREPLDAVSTISAA